MFYIFVWIFVALLFLMAFCAGGLFAMSGENSIWDWIKNSFKESREYAEELKAEKAFIKVNPLCVECQKEGKYRRSTRMWTHDKDPRAVCDQHYHDIFEAYYHPALEARVKANEEAKNNQKG